MIYGSLTHYCNTLYNWIRLFFPVFLFCYSVINLLGHLLTAEGYIENYFLQKHEVGYLSGIKPRGMALLSLKTTADEIIETPNYLMYKELLYGNTTIKLVYIVMYINNRF